jgi:hypothetical protein
VVGELVAHAPKRSRGVVLTSLAYQPDGHALRTLLPLVNRTIYPDGQWDYCHKPPITLKVADFRCALLS